MNPRLRTCLSDARRAFRVGLLFTTLAIPVFALSEAAVSSDHDTEMIRRLRMGTLVVQAAPGATVKVEQIRHAFWFGSALASQAFDGQLSPAETARYRQTFLENFNSAVPENALKWLSMEPQRGVVNYAVIDAILAWSDQNKIPLRGHNIFWGIEKFVPEWLKQLDNAELRRTLEARARDIGHRYRGRFVEYDLNNEMIHGNYYADRLGPQITLEMASWVKSEDPSAAIFVNDYDITTGRKLPQFIEHIRTLRAMGVPLAGLGVQGHLHGDSFDRAALRNSLDELAQFKLPIRITEFNVPGQRSKFYEHPEIAMTPEAEAQKARDLVDFYRICFANPAVEGILMWGFWEGANWIPQSSLFKRDWTPTPAAIAYHDLVYKEWWTRWEGTADATGRCEIPAYYGTHRVTSGGHSVTIELRKSGPPAVADLR
jgi:endo-1,4-beta-xylanase